MSIYKKCADRLRHHHRETTGGQLRAGHAHELVAAFFGYGSGAALREEEDYPLTRLSQAAVLIPDLMLMDRRRARLAGLATGLDSNRDLALEIADCLREEGAFARELWMTRDLEAYLRDEYMHENFSFLLDELSGETATTNAFFDELEIDELDIQIDDDGIVAEISGHLNGDTDLDRPFYGDSIAFTTIVTLDRVAGRNGYAMPRRETSGEIDESAYYDDE